MRSQLCGIGKYRVLNPLLPVMAGNITDAQPYLKKTKELMPLSPMNRLEIRQTKGKAIKVD